MGVQFAGNILVQSNGGPLPISMGGTGQTTSTTALNALLPTQAGQTGKVLTTNGSTASWTTASGGATAGGTDTQIQFNDAGNFAGNANFTINKTTGAVTAALALNSVGYNVADAAGTVRAVTYKTDTTDRWFLQTTSEAESGANTGSNFALVAVADNGATTNNVFTVSRASRVVDFKQTPTISDVAIGYLTVPQNAQGTYTCVLSDSGKHIYTASGGATYTIPSNASVAYPIGTAITFVNQSAVACTIAITSDTMYFAGTAGTTGSRTLGQYGVATAMKVGTTTWMISGTSLT